MKEERLTIRINKELKQQFQEYAKSNNVTPSRILNEFINVVTVKNK
jgi:antitoxin component of RelBE/YafQ-DinJ toxin-antitoxin module